jgi:hypothetical protein
MTAVGVGKLTEDKAAISQTLELGASIASAY